MIIWLKNNWAGGKKVFLVTLVPQSCPTKYVPEKTSEQWGEGTEDRAAA